MNTEVEDPVYRSFELAAERVGDLVEPVYARYFARDPEAAALMSHMDPLTRGRMLEEVVRLLMTGDYTAEKGYLDFEVKNHAGAYHVLAHMYGELLESVRDTVRDGIGADWDVGCAAAWDARLKSLLAEIANRSGG
ncbi:MAG: globin [Pseudomonadales bacterium]|nr:globin [Pseudomonadales bacterium]